MQSVHSRIENANTVLLILPYLMYNPVSIRRSYPHAEFRRDEFGMLVYLITEGIIVMAFTPLICRAAIHFTYSINLSRVLG